VVNVAQERRVTWHGVAPYAWLSAALVIGAFIRFWDLTGPSLFIDEGFVFHVATFDPHQILMRVAHGDFHPPLFYLVTHYLMGALHWPLWDYRYLTAAFSLTGIAATWAIARRCFGDTAAAIAALMLALDPALIVWDRLYRMYAVLVALSAVSWWLLLVCSDPATKRRVWWWVAYGATAITLPYLHYVGIVVVVSQFAYALARLPQLRAALFIDSVAILGLIPWVWAIRIQFEQAHYALRLDSSQFSGFAGVISAIGAYGVPERWMTSPHFDLAVSVFVLAVVLAGMYIGRRTLVIFWLAPIALHVAISLATGVNLLLPRYLFVYVPAYCICFGAVTALLLKTKYRVASVALLAAYAGVAVVSVYNVVVVPYYQFPDWYQVNALLLGKENKDDVIVLVAGGEYYVVNEFSGFRHHQILAPLLPADIDPTIAQLRANPQQRVWYIENQPGFMDSQRRIEHDLETNRPRLAVWQQQRLFEEDVVRIKLFGRKTSI
jgi:mannosyltransferase